MPDKLDSLKIVFMIKTSVQLENAIIYQISVPNMLRDTILSKAKGRFGHVRCSFSPLASRVDWI